MDFRLQEPTASPPVPGISGGQAYWAAIDEKTEEVCRVLDEKEDWVLEAHPDFRAKLDELIEAVKVSPAAANYCLAQPRDSLRLMAWLHTSTAMMLLHYAEQDRRELVNRFLEVVTSLRAAEPGNSEVYKAAGLAVERFLAFERFALLQRVFSQDRVEKVVAALTKARTLHSYSDL
ncbi:MAG: hypothetical protein AWU57_4 [Marinobacter sp. T13-3]|nr:MAG: hypothetical protein AWU57_4 [Marinobacter sp. T13-3]